MNPKVCNKKDFRIIIQLIGQVEQGFSQFFWVGVWTSGFLASGISPENGVQTSVRKQIVDRHKGILDCARLYEEINAFSDTSQGQTPHNSCNAEQLPTTTTNLVKSTVYIFQHFNKKTRKRLCQDYAVSPIFSA
jgi:hypothetical protein